MARAVQYTIHMLLPSLRNTQYQRGHNPHNDVPSFWSPCGLMCLTEDSLAIFEMDFEGDSTRFSCGIQDFCII